jgi:ribosomal protein L13E
LSSEQRKTRKAKVVEQKAEGALKGAGKEAGKAVRAVRQEVRRAEEAARGTRAPRPAQPRPAGRVPEAMVMSRHGTGMISRHGRGFSLGELAGAGLSPGLAARWGVMVDSRRRSVLEGNVSSLRGWSTRAASGALRKEAGAAEAKVEEVAEEIEKGAEAVVRGAEKAVRKEAKRAEGAVKGKAGKKPRAKKKAA